MLFLPGFDFTQAGVIGVDLFFALSAFLLTIPWWSKAPEELLTWAPWRDYFLRRFQRIFPPYALFLLAAFWLQVPLSNDVPALSAREFGRWLLLREGQAQFWTIPVEVKYYLVLPLILIVFAGLWRRYPRWGIPGMLSLLLLLAFPLSRLDHAWSLESKLTLHKYLPIFLLGSLAGTLHALVLRRAFNARWFRWLCEAGSLSCLALLAFQLLAPSLRGLAGHGIAHPASALYYGIICSGFLFCHLHGLGLIRAALSWWPMRALGFISYSTYLSHKLVMTHLRWASHRPIPSGWIAFFAIIAVGTLLYLGLERPLTRFRLRARRKPDPAADHALATGEASN